MATVPQYMQRAGNLRHRIVLQRNVPVRSDTGVIEDDWQDVTSLWASISTQGGREFYAARQVNSDLTHDIVIRYYPGVEEKMRVLFRDFKDNTERLYYIDSVFNVDGRKDYLHLFCRELNRGEFRAK